MYTIQLTTDLLDAWRLTAAHYAKPLADDDLSSKIQRLIHRDRKYIKDIWITFNMEREQIKLDYLNNRANLSAYLLGFHLPNSARMQLLLDRLKERQPQLADELKKSGPIQITDLGAGTGAASLCLADFLRVQGIQDVRMDLYDTSAPALETAKTHFTNLKLPDSYKISTRGLRLDKYEPRGLNPEHLHIFVMSYVWNELYRNQRAQQNLMNQLVKLSRTHKMLFFFSEPSNEEHARFMMQLRDGFLQNGLKALYPCSHSLKCPMLADKKDWCFSETLWNRPKEIELVDHLLDLDRHHLTHAGYILASEAVSEFGSSTGQVVVGKPKLKDQDGFTYLLCGSKGLSRLQPTATTPTYQRGQILN